MAKIKNLLIEMINSLDQEKRNINQFHLTSNHILTELRRTDCYVEQLKSIIKKLNNLMSEYEEFQKSVPIDSIRAKEYSKLINQISVELNYLLATNEAMNDNLKGINKTESIQGSISGKMMVLKEEINRAVKKARNILKY